MTVLAKKLSFLLFLGILAFFLCFTPNSKDKDREENTLMAGAAKINITPGTPIRMSGYGGRDEPFKGVHDRRLTKENHRGITPLPRPAE